MSIQANKHRGAYFVLLFQNVVLIQWQRLFDGACFSKSISKIIPNNAICFSNVIVMIMIPSLLLSKHRIMFEAHFQK